MLEDELEWKNDECQRQKQLISNFVEKMARKSGDLRYYQDKQLQWIQEKKEMEQVKMEKE